MNSRLGAADDPAVVVEDEAVLPVVPWSIARITAARALAVAARYDRDEVAQLAAAVEEAGAALAGRAVREVELDLADAIAGADGVDRHPDLHPVAGANGSDGAQRVELHRPLAGDRRRRLEPAAPADRPAGEAQGEAEAAADALAKTGDREVALAGLDRLDQRHQPRGRLRARSPSQSSTTASPAGATVGQTRGAAASDVVPPLPW